MDLRLDGKTAYITGSDSGIGRGIALTMAESGADVAIGYFSDEAGALETKRLVEAIWRQSDRHSGGRRQT